MKTLEHVIYGVGALLLGGSYFFQGIFTVLHWLEISVNKA